MLVARRVARRRVKVFDVFIIKIVLAKIKKNKLVKQIGVLMKDEAEKMKEVM